MRCSAVINCRGLHVSHTQGKLDDVMKVPSRGSKWLELQAGVSKERAAAKEQKHAPKCGIRLPRGMDELQAMAHNALVPGMESEINSGKREQTIFARSWAHSLEKRNAAAAGRSLF